MPASPDERPSPDLDRTIILAPLRKDADYLAELLSKHDLACEICNDSERLEASLSDPPALVIATHEALGNGLVDVIGQHARNQPAWSELPVIVLLDKSARTAQIHAALSERWPRTRLVFYSRPVATLELLSGIQSLLLARVRQRDVRDHLEREIELRRELNHRVKNILASVLSILHLTQRSAKNFEEMSRDFEERLTALSEVHSTVFQAGGEMVDLAAIVSRTLAPYRNGGGPKRISVEGPELTVSRDAATALGLCLHELVTNAFKYGALSTADGKVSLRWSVSGEEHPEFRLEWMERGGPGVKQPSRTGYGTRYLRAALASLLGREPAIDFNPLGLQFSTAGPLSRLTEKS